MKFYYALLAGLLCLFAYTLWTPPLQGVRWAHYWNDRPAPAPGEMNVLHYTLGWDYRTHNDRAPAVSTGVDIHTDRERLGVFRYHYDYREPQPRVEEVLTIDLTTAGFNTTEHDGRNYRRGGYTFELFNDGPLPPFSAGAEEVPYTLRVRRKGWRTPLVAAQSLILRKPNGSVPGIREYRRRAIPDDRLIRLLQLDASSTLVLSDSTRQAQDVGDLLILAAYDTAEYDALLASIRAPRPKNIYLSNDDWIVFPRNPEELRETREGGEDFIGYAFGEDGTREVTY